MKKGFTMVELLVVIVIIGLLIGIAVPSGIAISNKIKKKMLDTKIETIEQGAIVWGQNNKSKISAGKDNCSIEEIVDDEKVSHCISKSLTDLLNENALEEDKIENNKKILINPVNNKPLNECNVEIYIKNKRVYAKYAEDSNCSNTNDFEKIPQIILDGDEVINIELKQSYEMFELIRYESNFINEFNTIKSIIDSGAYIETFSAYYDSGAVLKDSNGNFISSSIVDSSNWNVSKEWKLCSNDCGENVIGYWKYNYAIIAEKFSYLENIDKVKYITRKVYLIDNSAPILVKKDSFSKNYLAHNIKEGNELYLNYNSVDENTFYQFDNYDGVKKIFDNVIFDTIQEASKYLSSREVYSLEIEDDFFNKNNYSISVDYNLGNYLCSSYTSPIINYSGITEGTCSLDEGRIDGTCAQSYQYLFQNFSWSYSDGLGERYNPIFSLNITGDQNAFIKIDSIDDLEKIRDGYLYRDKFLYEGTFEITFAITDDCSETYKAYIIRNVTYKNQ